jgi:hypothetical protein
MVITLEGLRKLVEAEISGLPASWKFIVRGAPVGVRQEVRLRGAHAWLADGWLSWLACLQASRVFGHMYGRNDPLIIRSKAAADAADASAAAAGTGAGTLSGLLARLSTRARALHSLGLRRVARGDRRRQRAALLLQQAHARSPVDAAPGRQDQAGGTGQPPACVRAWRASSHS